MYCWTSIYCRLLWSVDVLYGLFIRTENFTQLNDLELLTISMVRVSLVLPYKDETIN